MARGESADYSIDYERARLTFTNRRPISSASRITVEYQYTVNRYRRNLVAAGGRWERERRSRFVQGLSESRRPRPAARRSRSARPSDLSLAAAGDSAALALGSGVAAGGGDYDTVRVGAGGLAFVFAGRRLGRVRGAVRAGRRGRGEYADSSLVEGRTVFRYVGAGQGSFRVGRPLPLPESHQLWSLGGGARARSAVARARGRGLAPRPQSRSRAATTTTTAAAPAAAALRLEGGAPLGGVRRARCSRPAPWARASRRSAGSSVPSPRRTGGCRVNADLQHQRRVRRHRVSSGRKGGGELRATPRLA